MAAPRWLFIGRVSAPFGIAGEVRVTIDTEFPDRLVERSLYVGEERRAITVEHVRLHRREALVKIAGVGDVEAAEQLRGKELFIATEDAIPLPEGRYYLHEIVGLAVWTVSGEHYGQVIDVWTRTANDVYVIEHAGHQVLVPAIHDVVKQIDITSGKMVIDPIPGLE